MRRDVLLLSAALLTVGCGTYNRAIGTEPKPCLPGTTSPVSERALKRALGTEGIQLLRDDRCYPGTVVTLSNITDIVPYEEEAAIVAAESQIFCNISRSDGFGTRIERFVWRNDSHPTYLRVLNVVCSIYPEKKEHTDTLERALRRLPGVSTAPTTVPSADAIHD
jgi:hypothetical protein